MSFMYINIDEIKYNGLLIYYKKEINTELQKAKILNDKYLYYYKFSNLEDMRQLGKFIGREKISTYSYSNDYDYEIYKFEKENIDCNKLDLIYCIGIPDCDENMIQIEGITYQEYPVYYKNN